MRLLAVIHDSLSERDMRRILLSIALTAGLSGVAFGQTAPALEIAPGGKLRGREADAGR
jgi:hypothetical protein